MDKRLKKAIEDIYNINLGVRDNERVLIFTDDHDKGVIRVARLFKRVWIGLHGQGVRYMEFHATGGHGKEPPEPLWREAFGERAVNALRAKGLFNQLLDKSLDRRALKEIETTIERFKRDAIHVVVALSYFSTTHTRFRDLLTDICGTRYASMPLFDISMLKGPMQVDLNEMAKRARMIARRINQSDAIEINTPNGTSITFSIKGRKAKMDTGILTKRGSVSNLPAGEVFIAPLEGTANGKLVLEWAPTHKLKSHVVLDVRGGMVRSVSGDDEYADVLRKRLSERDENANIAEFGIGTNDKASRPDNILESEKILGTIHIALGDNSSFGGRVRTPFHQDFIFFKPTVVLINKDRRRVLMKDGSL
ncbi:MAG: aminopeptidase [Thermodesulfovibrionia bacterium]